MVTIGFQVENSKHYHPKQPETDWAMSDRTKPLENLSLLRSVRLN